MRERVFRPTVRITPHVRVRELELEMTKLSGGEEHAAVMTALGDRNIKPVRRSRPGDDGWRIAVGYDEDISRADAVSIIASILSEAGLQPVLMHPDGSFRRL
jgi:hypothetical protein